MRAIVFILVLIILVIILALATGYLDINQIRGARSPQISVSSNGVTARGGQAPAFDVETGSVKVGTKQTTVKVPALEVQKPTHNAVSNTANSM